MALFFIAYDLDKPGQNYKAVHELLEGWGAKRVLESTWILRKKNTKAKNVLAAMNNGKGPFDTNDRIVVIQEADWASYQTMTEIQNL